jgi:hypothetical protein
LVLGRLDDFAAQVRQGLETADFATRKEIIRALVKVIKIEAGHVRITYRSPPALLTPAPQGAKHGNVVTTVYAAILREINDKGAEARFEKVDRGQFARKGTGVSAKAASTKATGKKTSKKGSAKPADGTPGPKAVSELFKI